MKLEDVIDTVKRYIASLLKKCTSPNKAMHVMVYGFLGQVLEYRIFLNVLRVMVGVFETYKDFSKY